VSAILGKGISIPVKPLVSVVMPVYNGEKYIAAALQGVVSEFADDIEVIVVDDGSSDRSLEIVRGFMRRLPIRLISAGRRGNWVAVTNLGLREATCEWACLLHCDDLWLPGKIGRLRPELEQAKCSMVLHNAVFIGPDGRNLGPWTCPLSPGLIAPEEFLEHLLVQNFIAICSPIFRREAAIACGGLDEALWHAADWDLWLKLGSLGPTRFYSEALCAFRVHPESITAARQLRPGEWQQQLTTVFQRHFPAWKAAGKRRLQVERAAKASASINAALAAASRGERVQWREPIVRFLALGLPGWKRYMRDSRIAQRVRSRLKLRQSLIGTLQHKVVSRSC
jgi:glycosyltransferase involved in cell wall biosynthesis